MLVKNELDNVPVGACPDMSGADKKKYSYAATARVVKLPRCGKVLAVDIFNAKDHALALRFFSDKKNFLVCREWPAKQWLCRKPENLLGGWSTAYSTEETEKEVAAFLKKGLNNYHCYHGVMGYINGFASNIYAVKQEKAMKRKYALMEKHFDMFPDYPKDLPRYCEYNVFGYTRIFIDKLVKNKRSATCGHCGHGFEAGSETRHNGSGVCPKCGMKAVYYGTWVCGIIEDKAKICIAHKVKNQLLIRWTEVRRTYKNRQYEYAFYDFYRNLHLHTEKGPIVYSYEYKCIMNLGWDWYRLNNDMVCRKRTFVYADNLCKVFGDTYYHVDLAARLKHAREIPFTYLLDNLKSIPAAEYLFKMGMPSLAAELSPDELGGGVGFSGILGVSKQYQPLYSKYDVLRFEHKIIKGSRTWVSDESFEIFRSLRPDRMDAGDIIDLLEEMSFERFANYFTRQKALMKGKKLRYFLMLYKDYISMARGLDVDLSHKSVRFPKNIKEAHDFILPRFNEVKHQIEDANFQQAVEKLYDGMSAYEKGGYCIVFPEMRSELIIEGQSLNHCVGAESYYKNHIAGTKMIFFVRKMAERDKPYFTMEIEMRELVIKQLYGFGGSSAPAEVRKFANEFLNRLRPSASDRKAS